MFAQCSASVGTKVYACGLCMQVLIHRSAVDWSWAQEQLAVTGISRFLTCSPTAHTAMLCNLVLLLNGPQMAPWMGYMLPPHRNNDLDKHYVQGASSRRGAHLMFVASAQLCHFPASLIGFTKRSGACRANIYICQAVSVRTTCLF